MEYISASRLQTYYNVFGEEQKYAINAYYWNQLLCSSMYPMFQTLEVTFRNALHKHVPNHHPVFNNEFWFHPLISHIQDRRIKNMASADKNQWVRANGKRKKWTPSEQLIARMQKNRKKPADIVSAMSFGFWCKMLDSEYENVTHQDLLWPNMSGFIFPNYPYEFNRNYIFKALSNARKLRNRVFHHEPVWKIKGHENADIEELLHILNQIYDDCLNIVLWISQETYDEFLSFELDKNFKHLSCFTTLKEFITK